MVSAEKQGSMGGAEKIPGTESVARVFDEKLPEIRGIGELRFGGELFTSPVLLDGEKGSGEIEKQSNTVEEKAKRLGKKLFDVSNVYLINLGDAVYEAAFNTMKHASGGLIAFRELEREDGEKGLQVLCLDKGEGIEDLVAEHRRSWSKVGLERRGLLKIVSAPSELVVESRGRTYVKEGLDGELKQADRVGVADGTVVKMTFWEKDVKKI